MNNLSKSAITGMMMLGTLGLAGGALAMPSGDGPGHCMRGEHKGYGMHKKGGHGFNIERMSEYLELTAEQRSQIDTIVKDSKPRFLDIRKAMKENRAQLKELVKNGTYNESEVRKVADRQGDLKADMIVLRTQQRSKIRAVLTDEQRARMDEMRKRKHRKE